MNSLSLQSFLSSMRKHVLELKRSVSTTVLSLVFISGVSISITGCSAPSVSLRTDKAAAEQSAQMAKKPLSKPSADNSSAVTDAANVTDRVVPTRLNGDLLYDLLAAEFAGNAGDIQTSVNFYQKAAEKTGDPRIAARAAYIALYGKDYNEALSALNRWHKLEPKSAEIVRMYAVVYLKLHQPDKAIPYIKKIFQGVSASSKDKALALKALLIKEASTKDALVVLRKLNHEGNKNNQMLVLQARYEAQLKHYPEAMKLLDQVYKNDSSLLDVLIIKARILAAQGKNEAAAIQIKRAVDERPDNNILRLQYARMLVEEHKLEKAKSQYLILSDKLPDNAEISLSLALIYIDTKDLDKATAQLKKLVEMDKRTAIANYYLGRIAQSNGEKKQAIAYYLRVKSDAFLFDSQIRIATLLAALDRPDEGLRKLEALADAQTSWKLRVRVYLTEGEILRSQHRYAEGVKMYSRALQQKPDDLNLLYARGLMAEKANRLAMAEADLRKVISQDPENVNALNALGYTLADRTHRYHEALKYIKKAAALEPGDPAILDSLGWVNYRLGNMGEAEKWLSTAFKKLRDAEIAAHYGEVLWAQNKKAKAREIWQKGREINAKNPVLMETLKRINP